MRRPDNDFAHAENRSEGDAQVLWRLGTVPLRAVSFGSKLQRSD